MSRNRKKTKQTSPPEPLPKPSEPTEVKQHEVNQSEKPRSFIKSLLSDSKNIISLIAIIISAMGTTISIYYTYSSQQDQNRKWNTLNLARIELISEGFIVWKTISFEERTSIIWGYEQTIFSEMDGRKYTGRYEILNCLVLVDPATGKQVPDTLVFHSVTQAQSEYMHIQSQSLRNSAEIWKRYHIGFEFKNAGTTPATDIHVKITAKELEAISKGDLYSSTYPITLSPSAPMTASVFFNIPLSTKLPRIINFNVNLTYKKANGETVQQSFPVNYDSTQNYRSYGQQAGA